MRPRFANRGSVARRSRKRRACASFNEAPIRESGKFFPTKEGFEQALASMRPRFANRGSGFNAGRVATHYTSFNEAPIRESGKSMEFTL